MILLRHGATEANLARPPILQGRGINLGLAPLGIRQAEAAARFLANTPLDVIYSSPLVRARQTAEAIAAAQAPRADLTPRIVEALTEVHAGRWEGRTWKEIAVTDPEDHARFHEDASRWGYLDGESLTDVYHRVRPVFEKLLADNLGRRIAVIAHNIVNRAFIASLLGTPLSNYRSIAQDNCGINVIERQGETTTLRTLNWVPYGEEIVL